MICRFYEGPLLCKKKATFNVFTDSSETEGVVLGKVCKRHERRLREEFPGLKTRRINGRS